VNPIVSKNIRLRHPEHLIIGDDSIIDDFCYISTRLRLGRGVHIAANCTISGGGDRTLTVGDFSSISAGVTIWCASNRYAEDLVALVPQGIGQIGDDPLSGDVTMERCTGIGANSVVLPDNRIPEGTVIGALSLVPYQFAFEPWSVYAGVPVRRIGPRDRARVLAQVRRIEEGLGLRDSSGPAA
jgi:acetyltransferase-like isoleucine patch superfamily enzyme